MMLEMLNGIRLEFVFRKHDGIRHLLLVPLKSNLTREEIPYLILILPIKNMIATLVKYCFIQFKHFIVPFFSVIKCI